MALIKEYVAQVRTLIKQYTDDSLYPTSFIYSLLNNHRSFLIKRDADRNSTNLTQNFQLVCVTLEQSDFYDCDCIPANDCKVQKSICSIPRILSVRGRDLIRVYTPNNTMIEYIPASKLKGRKYIGLNTPYWTWSGNHIVLINSQLDVVIIEAVFEDPTQLDNFCGCGDNDQAPCYDASSDDFPIDSHLVTPMIDMTVRQIYTSFNIKDDRVNDNSPE